MSDKKHIAILLATTNNLAFAAGNCALALNKYLNIKDFDIVIFYKDLSNQNLSALRKINHVQLRPFFLDKNFIKILINNLPKQSRFRDLNHLMCFAHFEAFRLLDEYQTVLYYDIDISFQRDISGIFTMGPFAMPLDSPWTVRDQFTENISSFDMQKAAYCSAVMLLHDSIPYKQIYNFLYNIAKQYASSLINPDQACINLALQKFNIEPNDIPVNVYACNPSSGGASYARAIHFGNKFKVWNNSNLLNSFPEWYRVHLDWLTLGGEDFEQQKITFFSAKTKLDFFDLLIGDDLLVKDKIYMPRFSIYANYYKYRTLSFFSNKYKPFRNLFHGFIRYLKSLQIK